MNACTLLLWSASKAQGLRAEGMGDFELNPGEPTTKSERREDRYWSDIDQLFYGGRAAARVNSFLEKQLPISDHIELAMAGIARGITVCPFCNVMLADTASLIDHMRHQHDKHTCRICFKFFNSRRALGFHLNATHGAKDHLKCPICGKNFAHKQNKVQHLKSVHRVHFQDS
ncbi:hypothetical protein ACOMHN_036025 [Nucella lapillus]